MLSGKLVTQRLSVLIGRHSHLIHNRVIAVVVKLTVHLKSGSGENRLLYLLIADAQFQFAGILIQQRFIYQTIQHLLAQAFHITFVGRQFRIPVAQLLLHTVTFVIKRILKLCPADFLAIHFCGVVIASANQVTTNAGQNERHDNDNENNLEHETVCSRA